MSQAFQRAIGGVTPLGTITISAATPKQITQNLNISDKTYTFTCRQLVISVDASPAGEVYLNYGNVAGKDSHATAMIIQSGTVVSIPNGAVCSDGLIDATQWWLDGSASCVVAVAAVDASS